MRDNHWYVALTLGLGLGLTLALFWLLPGRLHTVRADPAIRYVALDGDDSKQCDSIADRCRTVQRAIDVAGPFDEIRVATGTYTDAAGTVATINKTVALLGGWNSGFTTCAPSTYPTTLDAHGNGRVMYISGAISPTIDGFIITGGNATNEAVGAGRGGGIYSSSASPIIQNNIITNNLAYTGTTSWGFGGGIYLYYVSASAIISGNRVLSNTASTTYYGLGGGLFLSLSATRVSGNEISGNSAGRGGAAVYLHDSDGATFDGNQIVSNTAVVSPTATSYGGGFCIEFTDPFTLTNNVIAQNRANTSGGGLYVYGSTGVWSSAGELVNNTIAQNNLGSGGEGVYLTGNSTLTLTNNIIVSHTYGIYATGGATVTADYTLFFANTTANTADLGGAITSTNEITGGAPLFVDLAEWDYHIQAGSPAVDAGVAVPGLTTDIDGDPRPAGAGYDLGADELWYKIHLPLVMRDYQP